MSKNLALVSFETAFLDQFVQVPRLLVCFFEVLQVSRFFVFGLVAFLVWWLRKG